MKICEKTEYMNVLSSILTDMGYSNYIFLISEQGDFTVALSNPRLDRLHRLWRDQQVVPHDNNLGCEFRIHFNEPQKFITLNFNYSRRQLATIPYSDWKSDNWRDLRIISEHIRVYVEYFAKKLEEKLISDGNNPQFL